MAHPVEIEWREMEGGCEFWLQIGDWKVTESIFLEIPDGSPVEMVAAVALVNLLGIRHAKVKGA